MPCWGIHLHIANELNKKLNLEINQFLIGNVLPDIYSGWIIKGASKIEKYEVSHSGRRTTLNKKIYTLPNIEKFEEENKSLFKENDLLLGYFSHILTDYFFNKYTFLNYYVKDEKSKTIGCYLKNGEFISADVEEVKAYKHLDFSIFSNKKLQYFPEMKLQITENLIKKSKQIKTMEIFGNDLEITVEYLNQMILDKSEKTRNSKFVEYKIFTEEKLQEMTKECIEFVYNKVKDYAKKTSSIQN